MGSFTYQKWIKWESETAIINALFDGNKRFGELLEITELSKPVLIRRLKELKKKGKVAFIPEEEIRRFYYHLVKENITIDDVIQKKIDILSKVFVDGLIFVANTQEISNKEYSENLNRLVPLIFRFKMISYNTAPEEIQREWLKVSLGNRFANNIEKIYPEDRCLFPTITPFWELIAYRHADPTKFKEQLLELLESQIKLTKDSYKEMVLKKGNQEE